MFATPAQSPPVLSRNRTELETVLPRVAAIRTAIHTHWAQVGFVPAADLLDHFDQILEDLGVDVPDGWYPLIIARLHTILCTECPAIRYRSGTARAAGWQWTRRQPASGPTATDSAIDDDDA